MPPSTTRLPALEMRHLAGVAPAVAQEGEMPLKVVIMYGDFDAGHRAMHMLADVVRDSGEGIQLDPVLWRLDVLDDPGWFERSLSDATDADILVLASAPSVASVRRWHEAWLARSAQSNRTAVLSFSNGAWKMGVSTDFLPEPEALLSPGGNTVGEGTEVEINRRKELP